MKFVGYLSLKELLGVRDALIDASLDRDLDVMLEPIDSQFRAGLPDGTSSSGRLTQVLMQLNREHNLRNGDVPFAQFLEVAKALATGRSAEAVLEAALDKLSYSVGAPPGAIGVAAGGFEVDPEASKIAGVETEAARSAVNLTVSLEAQTNAYDMTVGVEFLQKAIVAARSVVKLLVHRHVGGTPEESNDGGPRLVSGTGWMIGPRLLITNHHVIDARSKEGFKEPDATPSDFVLQGENTYLQFDYVSKEEVPSYKTGSGALLYNDKELDFALLRVPADAPDRPPLTLRPFAIQKNLIQALGLGVNLLQYPLGKPLKLGFRNNYVVFGDHGRLSYLTDTDFGSSGSPVSDDSWKVAALHSGSRGITDQRIEILGHKYTRENYGIPITTILEHLRHKAPALFAEIQQGQAGGV